MLKIHPDAIKVAKIVAVRIVLPVAITAAALAVVNKIDSKIPAASE